MSRASRGQDIMARTLRGRDVINYNEEDDSESEEQQDRGKMRAKAVDRSSALLKFAAKQQAAKPKMPLDEAAGDSDPGSGQENRRPKARGAVDGASSEDKSSDEEEQPKGRGTARRGVRSKQVVEPSRACRPARAAAPKKMVEEDSDMEDSDEGSDPPPAAKRPTAPKRPAAPLARGPAKKPAADPTASAEEGAPSAHGDDPTDEGAAAERAAALAARKRGAAKPAAPAGLAGAAAAAGAAATAAAEAPTATVEGVVEAMEVDGDQDSEPGSEEDPSAPSSPSASIHSEDEEGSDGEEVEEEEELAPSRGTRRSTRAAAAPAPAGPGRRVTRGEAAVAAGGKPRQGAHRPRRRASGSDDDDSFSSGGGRRRRHRRSSKESDTSDPSSSSSEEVNSEEDNSEEGEEEEERGRGARVRRAPARAGRAAPAANKKKSRRGRSDSEEEESSSSEEEDDDDGSDEPAAQRGPTAAQRAAALKRRVSHAVIERVLEFDEDKNQFLVKFKGWSFRKATWITRKHIETARLQLMRNFLQARKRIEIDEDWTRVERVIARRPASRWVPPGKRTKAAAGRKNKADTERWEFLVKWCGLDYGDCTWEEEEDLSEDQEHIELFMKWDNPPPVARPNLADLRNYDNFPMPTFGNGRKLRDYQETSVRWMISNYVSKRSCILGDEMGLGKTAQSISVLEVLRQVASIPGPFLLVAPLTTLGHWQREIRTWTDMNCVLYAGTADDKAVIREHEFFCVGEGAVNRRRGAVRFNALLISYETLLKETTLLRKISWAAGVFDEAHKLKGVNSSTRAAAQMLDITWKLLLTGTPIQNNLTELWSIMNVLDSAKHPSLDGFMEEYAGKSGGPPSVEQVHALRELLAPVLLRRMKEDVETLPEKEEVVVWVELTPLQHQFYQAIYGREVGTLLEGAAQKNIGGLRNLAMELRKLCCHPFLCDGLEQECTMRNILALAKAQSDAAAGTSSNGGGMGPLGELELLVRSCGKMVLLHKLLPKLRKEGRKVLIFSQFTRMLDVLEDYLHLAGMPLERIDGNTKGRDRQAAIDRFSAGSIDTSFVFLLSTRAGGQGITLTAADTAIIYDSDWNPQNDLQAMARCHRIGQDKEVTIYRLVTKGTYENHLFSTASRKYGLDEAILGGGGGDAGGDPEADAARLAALLAHGAHGLIGEGSADAVAGEATAFQGEDIEQILHGRTEKRLMGGRAGNTFSTARFSLVDDAAFVKMEADAINKAVVPTKELWEQLMPQAVEAHKEKVALRKRGPVVDGPRARKEVNYCGDGMDADTPLDKGKGKKHKGRRSASMSDSDVEMEEGARPSGGGAGSGAGTKGPKRWSKVEIKELEDRLLQFGINRWEYILDKSALLKGAHTLEEVQQVGSGLAALFLAAPEAVNAAVARIQAAQAAAAKEAEEKQAAADPGSTNPLLPNTSIQGEGGRQAASKRANKEREECGPALAALLKAMKLPEHALVAMTHQDVLKRWCKAAESNARALRDVGTLYQLMQASEDAECALVEKLQQQPKAEGEAAPDVSDQYPSNLLTGVVSGALHPGTSLDTVQWVGRDLSHSHKAGMPAWWSRACDEQLLRGAVKLGLHPLKVCVDAILRDPELGFTERIRPDMTYRHEAGAVTYETDAAEGSMPTMVLPRFVRTRHVAMPKLWMAKAGDAPPPSLRKVQKLLATPQTCPPIEYILDVCVMRQFARTPEGVEIKDKVVNVIEMLVKFKGYCADLFTWLPENDLKNVVGFPEAFQAVKVRLVQELGAETQACQAALLEGRPFPQPYPAPPRPEGLGYFPYTDPKHRVQKLGPVHWDAFRELLGSRLQTLVRAAVDGDAYQQPKTQVKAGRPPKQPGSANQKRATPTAAVVVTSTPEVKTAVTAQPAVAAAPTPRAAASVQAAVPVSGSGAAAPAAPAAKVTSPPALPVNTKASAAAKQQASIAKYMTTKRETKPDTTGAAAPAATGAAAGAGPASPGPKSPFKPTGVSRKATGGSPSPVVTLIHKTVSKTDPKASKAGTAPALNTSAGAGVNKKASKKQEASAAGPSKAAAKEKPATAAKEKPTTAGPSKAAAKQKPNAAPKEKPTVAVPSKAQPTKPAPKTAQERIAAAAALGRSGSGSVGSAAAPALASVAAAPEGVAGLTGRSEPSPGQKAMAAATMPKLSSPSARRGSSSLASPAAKAPADQEVVVLDDSDE